MARRKWWLQIRCQVSPSSACSIVTYHLARKGGHKKLTSSSSYAPGVVPAGEAAKHGYGQILWLSGDDHTLTEVSDLPALETIQHGSGC